MTPEIAEYSALKLSIAEPIRTLLELARLTNDELGVSQARSLLVRLAEDRFNVAVVGLFNRGKSSLINAMLGSDRLPTGVVPLTSVITTIGFGDHEKLLLHFIGSQWAREEPLDRLGQYVSELENPGNRLGVEHAEVRLPSDLLRLGFFFVDTPGIGSAIAANTETTRRYFPEIDAALFVTSFDSPLSAADVALLREVQRFVRTIFVVANKADLVSRVEREDALRYMREQLGAIRDGANTAIIAVSARSGDGIPELHAVLSRFLRTRKLREILVGVLRRADAVAKRLAVHAVARAQMAATNDAAGRRTNARDEIARVKREARTIADHLRQCVERNFLKCVAPDLALHAEAAVGGRETFAEWLGLRHAHFMHVLSESVSADLTRLAASQAAIDRVAERLAGIGSVNEPSVMLPVVDLPEDTWLSQCHVPPFKPRPSDESFWSSVPLLRIRARRIADERKARAIGEYRQLVAMVIGHYAQDWVQRLLYSFDRSFDASAAAVKATMSEPLDQRRFDELQRVSQRLELLRARIDTADDGGTGPRSLPAYAPARIRRCPFCERVREAVFAFLANEQYELHISESRRHSYVDSRGFCPLHLWQFGRIASPQGVCVAYAPVVSDLGRGVAALSESPTLEQMRDTMRKMAPTPTACPACQVARAAEATLLSGVDLASSMVCLPHLAFVLEHTSDIDRARDLTTAQARIMERIATDMRNYALKVDAIRRYLLTDSEEISPVRALSLIAAEKGVRSTTVDEDE